MKAYNFLIVIMIILAISLSGCASVTFDEQKSESEQSPGVQKSIEVNAPEPVAEEAVTEALENNYTIVIDPGHQKRGNSSKEPVGPGASETKARVTGGTYGPSSGLYEYELNLTVSLKLKSLLEKKGYNVIMTRETNDVDISNSERAAIANEAKADAFVRVHANGSENPGVSGSMTICQTADNPYNGYLYDESYRLSECILDSLVAETGSVKQYVWETDTMSGINWAEVPSTIVEVGYMTNKEEDLLMATEEYQDKVAKGIAKGIDEFFAR